MEAELIDWLIDWWVEWFHKFYICKERRLISSGFDNSYKNRQVTTETVANKVKLHGKSHSFVVPLQEQCKYLLFAQLNISNAGFRHNMRCHQELHKQYTKEHLMHLTKSWVVMEWEVSSEGSDARFAGRFHLSDYIFRVMIMWKRQCQIFYHPSEEINFVNQKTAIPRFIYGQLHHWLEASVEH